jgi:hypothetical protein
MIFALSHLPRHPDRRQWPTILKIHRILIQKTRDRPLHPALEAASPNSVYCRTDGSWNTNTISRFGTPISTN